MKLLDYVLIRNLIQSGLILALTTMPLRLDKTDRKVCEQNP